MDSALTVWCVVDWDAQYETARTLRKAGPRDEIVVGTDLESEPMRRLLDAPGGFLAFAVWNLVCRIAATCQRRGALIRDGVPLTDIELARLARTPLDQIQAALKLLESPHIRLLERVSVQEALLAPRIVAAPPRKPKIQPLMTCPVCLADLTRFYQLDTGRGAQSAQPEVHSTSQRGCHHERAAQRVEAAPGSERACPTLVGPSPPSPLPGVPGRGGIDFVTTPPHFAKHPPERTAGTSPTQRGVGSGASPRLSYPAPVPRHEKLDTTQAEVDEVERRFQCGELSFLELMEFIETHYFAEDAEEEEEEEALFHTDIPPPGSRPWR